MGGFYEGLLSFAKPQIDDYLKNVVKHNRQFEYDVINSICYEKMFKQNNYDKPLTVKELKADIKGFKEICKNCGSYFMNPRNKSKKIYDVQFGILLEDLFMAFIKEKFSLNVTHGDKSNKRYPDCMLLGTDKGILCYFEVKYHGAPFILANNTIGKECYLGSATMDKEKLIKQLEIVESDINRPVFYVHWIDYPCLKGIFFETSEQVKNKLFSEKDEFNRQARKGDYNKKNRMIGYTRKFYSSLLEMGTFEELIAIFKDMKINGLKM